MGNLKFADYICSWFILTKEVAVDKQEARELEASEKCEREMMGTSAERERGVMGRINNIKYAPKKLSRATGDEAAKEVRFKRPEADCDVQSFDM